MEVSEKKLGCLKGIKRTNMDKCGYIEGSVNESLKSGQKEVCVENGKAIFWIVNDYDVTVGPEDVASYTVSGVNVFTRESSKNVNNQRVYLHQHTVNYDICFTNGKTGRLKVTSLTVCGKEANYNAINDRAFRNNVCPSGYVPEVVGWLNPQGERDEKFDDVLCPEGYKPKIVGFRKVSTNVPCRKLAKALGLAEYPLEQKVEFGGQKLSFIRVSE